jgi:teichuronic acid biosynthesis protein TuaE
MGGRFFLSLPVIFTLFYFYIKVIEILAVDKKPQFQTYLSLILFGFLIWSFISLLWSDYSNWSFLLELAFYILFAIFIINFCKLNRITAHKIHELLLIVVFMMVLYGLYRYLTGASPWFEFTDHYETELGTRNSDIFIVVTALPVVFSGLLIFYKGTLKRLLVFIAASSYVLAILLSLSRGQIVTSVLILGALSGLYVILMRVKYTTLITTITLGLLLTAGIWLCFAHFFADTHDILINRFDKVSDDERIEIASFALSVAKEHPFTGIGLDNLQYIMPQMVDAHNAYLNVLSELGIVGFVLFCLILLYPAYRYVKLYKKIKTYPDIDVRGMYIQGFGFLIALIISSVFNTFYSFIYFWIIYVISCCDLIYLDSAASSRFVRTRTSRI